MTVKDFNSKILTNKNFSKQNFAYDCHLTSFLKLRYFTQKATYLEFGKLRVTDPLHSSWNVIYPKIAILK